MDQSWIIGIAGTLAFAMIPSAAASRQSLAPVSGVAQNVRLASSEILVGNVTAIVPGASIAASDSVSHTMEPGRSYRATFLVWAAPNARNPTVAVSAHGAEVRGCLSTKLRPGAGDKVTCDVRPRLAHSNVVTITVVIHTRNLGAFTRTYEHEAA
jgi:hypothetical protein